MSTQEYNTPSVLGRKQEHISFSICDSCYWCASNLGYRNIKECPACKKASLESIPISQGEHFIFDHDDRHGTSLKFWTPKQSSANPMFSYRGSDSYNR